MREKRERKLFILRTERPCKIVPTSNLQSGLKMFTEKIVRSEVCFSAKKGEIFKESPLQSQPENEHRIQVSSYGENGKVLEVNTDDLTEISQEIADLLLPVEDSEKRYELYSKRGFTELALAAKVGGKVEMLHEGSNRNGTIREIGNINGKQGLRFRIDLQVEEKKLIHSTCYKSTASLETIATVDQLTFLPSSKNAFHHNGTKNIEKHVEFGNFRVGMKVVLFRDNKVLTGTIRFIGKLDNLKEMTFGIELNAPEGNSDGLYMGERVIQCKQNHAIFAKGEEIMDSKLYKEDDPANKLIEKQMDGARDNQLTRRRKNRTLAPALVNAHHIQFKNSSDIDRLKGSRIEEADDDMLAKDPLSDQYNNPSTSSDFIAALQDAYQTTSSGSVESLSTGNRGTPSLPFHDNHFGSERKNLDENFLQPSVSKTVPRRGSESSFDEIYESEVPPKAQRPKTDNYDPTLQVDSVVQVSINGVPRYGLIKWIGFINEYQESQQLIAGLELEEPSQEFGDGRFKESQYFRCPQGRGIFVKLSTCKKDERFVSSVAPSASPVNQNVEEVEGNFLPPSRFEEVKVGRMRGIQGHHNSCYLDSTLFAMFSFTMVFDSVLYREKRPTDIEEYEQVRKALKNAIVNPLRVKGFVNAASVLRLRSWLDKLANVPGFMNEEKDPEEFLMLLLKDVFKVDPFLKIRTNEDVLDSSYFYQILVDREESNPLPSLQYLFELSFLTGSFRLEEVPAVLVIQLPRSGLQKMYKRIRIDTTLDVSSVLSHAPTYCFICEEEATYSCKDCCVSFGWEHPFIYLCSKCNGTIHQHSKRKSHQVKEIERRKRENVSQECNGMKILELFAVVCIKTSHYVTFVKCGDSPDEKWLFFDSMADRVGEATGHNVPEIVECPEIKEWLNETPLTFTESDSKNTPEKALRLFEDASLCFYKSKELSMYM